MSDLEALATLVRKLRDAQKEYFRTRHHRALIESTQLEKIVDKKLSEILDDNPFEL